MADGANSFSLLTATLWIGAGAIVAAFVAGYAARFVKISEHRQNWINALRDDVATYIVRCHNLHADTQTLFPMSPELSEYRDLKLRISTNTDDANILFNRIILRLNQNESDHVDLEKLLSNLREEKQPNIALENKAIEQARRVFKREWDVAKYGELVDVCLCLKSRWRKIFAAVKKC